MYFLSNCAKSLTKLLTSEVRQFDSTRMTFAATLGIMFQKSYFESFRNFLDQELLETVMLFV